MGFADRSWDRKVEDWFCCWYLCDCHWDILGIAIGIYPDICRYILIYTNISVYLRINTDISRIAIVRWAWVRLHCWTVTVQKLRTWWMWNSYGFHTDGYCCESCVEVSKMWSNWWHCVSTFRAFWYLSSDKGIAFNIVSRGEDLKEFPEWQGWDWEVTWMGLQNPNSQAVDQKIPGDEISDSF